MITAVFSSQLQVLERRNFAPHERNFVSWKRNFVIRTRNFVQLAPNFATKFLAPKFRFDSLPCLQNFTDIRTIVAPKFRRFFVWNRKLAGICVILLISANFACISLHGWCSLFPPEAFYLRDKLEDRFSMLESQTSLIFNLKFANNSFPCVRKRSRIEKSGHFL